MSQPRWRASRAVLLLWSVIGAACRTAASPRPQPASPDSVAELRDIAYLASDRLEGRGTGTPGNDSAAAFIARRFASLRLTPAFASRDSACRAAGSPDMCQRSYLQPFTATSVAAVHAGLPARLPTQNVAGILRGSDPVLRDQYVIVGAHFDHLGRSSFGALDPEAGAAIRNGADDNASGTATVLELARLLHRDPPRRSVIFVTFTGEELGLLGSQHFVEHSPVPLDHVQAMLNFDMVGRLRDDRLIVYGVETAHELRDVVTRANTEPHLQITATGDGMGASDQTSFYTKDLPVLHFFTNIHDDYHRSTDDAEKINAGGVARVTAIAERVVRDLANRPERLTFVRVAASAPTSSSREGSNTYLGSVPDMGAADVVGVRISAVRAGSPADSAGLKAGDTIVEFDGKPVKDLYSYTAALYARQPGDTVTIIVVRANQPLTLRAVLGKRG
jgi:hypothetical protein